MSAPLPPGATVGILGGGQLGRMLALAAAPLGYRTAVFCPDPLSPAFHVTNRIFKAGYGDTDALAGFAEACDVITYEFENIPAETVTFLADKAPLRPNPQALATTQDRLFEKDFLSVLDVPVASYRDVDGPEALAQAVELLGPVVAKTRRFGYDGKGQARLSSKADAAAAWSAMGTDAAIAEARIAFDREISVIAARALDGDIVTFPPAENRHQGGILRSSRVPAAITGEAADIAAAYAHSIAEALDFIGVLAVEMFVIDKTGEVIVNEIAPRVHNSGHWTIEGAVTSQFAQHIRAVCGLPLGDASALGHVRMDNLIGADIDRRAELLADRRAHLHHYGKAGAKPGRKMGHVTWVESD